MASAVQEKKYEMGPDSGGVMTCLVCGMGSHRLDWIKKSKPGDSFPYVACDSHSDSEIAEAVKEANPPAAPPSSGALKVPQTSPQNGGGPAQKVQSIGQTQPPTLNQGAKEPAK